MMALRVTKEPRVRRVLLVIKVHKEIKVRKV